MENPETITIAISRADGGMTVKRIILPEFGEVTPEAIEAELAKRPHMFANHLGWEIVPDDYVDANTDRTFRAAWRHNPGGPKPDHDMGKARDIQRDNLRRARANPLEALDTAYLLADEQGDQARKLDVAAQKQKLRDVTTDSRIEAAATVEELKALTLDVLTGDRMETQRERETR